MIVNSQIQDYINLLDNHLPDWLEDIRQLGIDSNVPVMKKESMGLLGMLVRLYQPQSILEVGCAIGFSALGMLQASESNTLKITTLELDAARVKLAKEHFKRYDLHHQIEVLQGDALELLDRLTGPYDFVLLDAAKGQYDICLEKILPLLPERSLIISDNVLQEGETALSRYAVRRRDRTIHKRMRDYLHKLMNDERLSTYIAPIGDGVAISLKLK